MCTAPAGTYRPAAAFSCTGLQLCVIAGNPPDACVLPDTARVRRAQGVWDLVTAAQLGTARASIPLDTSATGATPAGPGNSSSSACCCGILGHGSE